MDLSEVPTPALVLDRSRLDANTRFMAARATELDVRLRPHMKTAKSADVARVATAGQFGGITVSTLAEARYFLAHGFTDITYAVGLAPGRIDEALALVRNGAKLNVLTDSPAVAAALAGRAAATTLPRPLSVLIEIDCGDGRGGLQPDAPELTGLAGMLDAPKLQLAGVLTHAGHSYACRSRDEIAGIAEQERAAAVFAAGRLRAAGHACETVSVGSTPTATHAHELDGVSEMRPGVYMFGDLDQVGLGSLPLERLAVSVLASVIGVYPDRVLIDAGGLALSKDASAQRHGTDIGYGLVMNLQGELLPGAHVAKANQEHGIVKGVQQLAPGDRLRVLPNHVCMTAAAHPGYYVVEGGTQVTARWPRINGWEQWR
ncbi:MAG: alanine racemase [Planctomycetes bacterium]|nr:alanine racemase [Planctomycetota bacterium]MCB9934120.1 alanine racemase [Planctomycetota bacterium]